MRFVTFELCLAIGVCRGTVACRCAHCDVQIADGDLAARADGDDPERLVCLACARVLLEASAWDAPDSAEHHDTEPPDGPFVDELVGRLERAGVFQHADPAVAIAGAP